MKAQMTLGHDSEFALSEYGIVRSALDVFNEDVYEDENGRYFADNLNCEIAITPTNTLQGFHSKTEHLLELVRDQGYDLLFEPMIEYPPSSLNHPLAREAGCSADYSAYTQEKIEPPNFDRMDGTRSLGGHVHASLDGGNPYWHARWMDALVTLPLLQYERKSGRRALYGGPGCMRVKPYGCEYRTLSSFWINTPDHREFVWEMTHRAAELSKTTDPDTVDQWEDIPTAIHYHDVNLANKCIDRLYLYGVTYA